MGVDVTVTQHGGRVELSATRAGIGHAGSAPCLQRLSIAPTGADIDKTAPLWEVAADGPSACRARFTYGQTPPGWSSNGPAPRLDPGVRYSVEASGPGFIGGATFTMRAGDGVLSDPG